MISQTSFTWSFIQQEWLEFWLLNIIHTMLGPFINVGCRIEGPGTLKGKGTYQGTDFLLGPITCSLCLHMFMSLKKRANCTELWTVLTPGSQLSNLLFILVHTSTCISGHVPEGYCYSVTSRSLFKANVWMISTKQFFAFQFLMKTTCITTQHLLDSSSPMLRFQYQAVLRVKLQQCWDYMSK